MALSTVNNDIHYILSKSLDYKDIAAMCLVIKNPVYVSILKDIHTKFSKSVKKIENFYFYNNPYKIFNNIKNYNDITKNVDIRVRVVEYDLIFCQRLPEFLTEKCSFMFTTDDYTKLKNYIRDNLDSDKSKRKRSEIMKFLMNPEITIEHLDYNGW